jgi:tRNA(adenine34) deaminase
VTPEDDMRFMRLALEEAQLAADEGEVPIGAVVVCEGEVVARAHNRRETDHDPSAHAEFAAMVAASQALERWRLTGCTVYVTLEPCLMCAGAIINARVPELIIGARDPKAGAFGSLCDLNALPVNHHPEITFGVMEEECADLLRKFFREKRERGIRWKKQMEKE